MGMADFYLNIYLKKHSINVFEALHQAFNNEKMFRVLANEEKNCLISIESKFDNFIPSLIITFDFLSSFAENIDSIETHGMAQKFDFDGIEKFFAFMFSSNKDRLLSYYKQMGCFIIDSEKYYKKRIKLKKYYKKLK